MRRTATALVCVFTVACGRSSEDVAQATPSSATASTTTRPALPAASDTSACPHTGLWATCTVEQRLRHAGFVAKRITGKPPKRAGFSVAPVAYTLGRARLELFVYPDEASLARDMAKLDTLSVAPVGITPAWDGTPQLIRAGNLAAVYIGDNPRQAERLALALTAGAPQPGSPR